MNEKIEVLQTAYEYSIRLEQGIEGCVENFQTGNLAKANEDLVLIIDGLDWLMKAITLTQDVHKEVIDLSDVKAALPELLEGIENSDSILIADILQYEILEGVTNWKEVMHSNLVEM